MVAEIDSTQLIMKNKIGDPAELNPLSGFPAIFLRYGRRQLVAKPQRLNLCELIVRAAKNCMCTLDRLAHRAGVPVQRLQTLHRSHVKLGSDRAIVFIQ